MITLKEVCKSFHKDNKSINVLSNFSYQIKDWTILWLFWPNWAWKTTLLNIIAKMETPDSGLLETNNKTISYVHQNYSEILLPRYNCLQNITLVRDIKKLDKEEWIKLLEEMKKDLDLDFSLEKYPNELSGWQKQIVAIIRALIVRPDVIILDEAMSWLDIERREIVMNLLKKYTSENTIIIFCSHRWQEISWIINKAIVLDKMPLWISKEYSLIDMWDTFTDKISSITFNDW